MANYSEHKTSKRFLQFIARNGILDVLKIVISKTGTIFFF